MSKVSAHDTDSSRYPATVLLNWNLFGLYILVPSFWPPLGRSKRIAQFLAKLSNFSVFCLFSACRAKGLVEGFDKDCGPWLDALGVELTGGDSDNSTVIGHHA